MDNIRTPWDNIFISFAKTLIWRSCCLKYKTATIVTNGTQIVSLGYNGTFSKTTECNDYWHAYWVNNYSNINKSFEEWIATEEFRLLHRNWSTKNEIHAEINALNWISKKDITDNYKLYTILSPCDQCAKVIISYGIKHVFYQILYKNGTNALKLLESNGITCKQLV